MAEAYLYGKAHQTLSTRHDACRSLIRIWVENFERGTCDDDPSDRNTSRILLCDTPADFAIDRMVFP
ncbi:MAG: hypothetical protein F4103_10240 [Boseongicola sp. SB0673_bin_14]|nr:hypothetical protein [Boseongicola sp. SB0673_bin_14]